MIETHSPFEGTPQNEEQKIWRYLDFTKFVELLNSESLYFARADYFEDIFEGSLSKISIEHRRIIIERKREERSILPEYSFEWFEQKVSEQRKKIAINCWHMNDFESAAMWKLYLKSNEGVAIQSTFRKLKTCLDQVSFNVHLGVVKYVDYESYFIPWGNILAPYVYKRKSFEHENELRAAIVDHGNISELKREFDHGGIKVKIDIFELVERIYVSPYSQSWFTKLVESVCSRYRQGLPIVNSALNLTPLY